MTRIVAAVLATLIAPSAFAQPQLIVTNAFGSAPPSNAAPALIAAIDPGQQRIVWSAPSGDARQVAVSSDGRYVAWTRLDGSGSPRELVVRDAGDGQAWTWTLRSPVAEILFRPSHAALLVRYTTGSVDRIERDLTVSYTGCPSAGDMALTLDGRQLFVLCGPSVHVLDVVLMRKTREWPLAESWQFLEVNGDGSRFAVLRDAGLALPPELRFFDAATGTVLATVSGPADGSYVPLLLQANADRSRLYASFHKVVAPLRGTGVTRVFSFDTLAQLAETAPITSLASSPDDSLVVASRDSGGASASVVVRIDPQTFAVTESVQVGYSANTQVVIGAPPLAPLDLVATVSSPNVSIQWRLPLHSPAPTGYALDVRLRPDGPLVATIPIGGFPSYGVVAPPGTFYVSLRGYNYFGFGPASAQVQVIVR